MKDVDDEYFMQIALNEANKAYKNNDIPVGCVIVFSKNQFSTSNNNKAINHMLCKINKLNINNDYIILSKAYNKRNLKKNAIYHAEILAIEKACKVINDFRLDGTTMYCTLEPCQMCAGAIIQSRIKKLVIGTKSDKSGSCGSIINLLNNKNFNHKVDIVYGIMKNECENLLKNYFVELRKNK